MTFYCSLAYFQSEGGYVVTQHVFFLVKSAATFFRSENKHTAHLVLSCSLLPPPFLSQLVYMCPERERKDNDHSLNFDPDTHNVLFYL